MVSRWYEQPDNRSSDKRDNYLKKKFSFLAQPVSMDLPWHPSWDEHDSNSQERSQQEIYAKAYRDGWIRGYKHAKTEINKNQ